MNEINQNILVVENLWTRFLNSETNTINKISFDLKLGQTLGVVGETGSGKTLSFLSLLGLISEEDAMVRSGASIYSSLEGNVDLQTGPKNIIDKLRAKEIAIIFQNPLFSLNPLRKCGKQIQRIIEKNLKLSAKDAIFKTEQVLKDAELKDINRIFHSFPHQLSGGELQRVLIAMGFSCDPRLIILDEPTASLDLIIQREIMELLKKLKFTKNVSIVFISHNLPLIGEISDHIIHIDHGEIIANQSKLDFFNAPAHEKSAQLINQLKAFNSFQYKPKPKMEMVLMNVENVSKFYTNTRSFKNNPSTIALQNVSFKIFKNEKLGIVGESGSGKTTIGKCIANLILPSDGSISFVDQKVKTCYLFQDAFSAMDPFLSVFDIINEAIIPQKGKGTNQEREQSIVELLKSVKLDSSILNRKTNQLSGGQRQRVNLARGLATESEVLICDEITSGLDLIVQYEIIELMKEISKSKTIIFISHDLSLVKYFCDRIIIFKEGRIVEIAENQYVFNNPKEEYTKQLINSIPSVKDLLNI